MEKIKEVLKEALDIPTPTTEKVSIETTQPLFKITGLDECGNVQLKTGTEVKLRKGDKSISLQKEHLQNVLEKSQQISETLSSLTDDEMENRVKKILDMYASAEKNENNILVKNKNAYEIRELILENTIKVVSNYSKNISLEQIVEQIMKTAAQFYSFVENRR